MGTHSAERWVLAFDASCGRCRRLAGVVRDACGDRLEVLALSNTDVERWREQALGSDAPWAPTLLRVRGGDGVGDSTARAWTGPAMALPLLRRLGVRSTVRLSRALGDLRAAARRRSDQPGTTAAAGIGRQRFLKLGAGVVAGGLLLSGRDVAMAGEPQDSEQAHAWVRANRDRLPTTYDAFAKRPLTYRKAIYAELPPQVRSDLWTAHVDRFRAVRSELTADQRDVVSRARAIAADHGTFERGRTADLERRVSELRESATAAFGEDQARDLLATLGPRERVSPRDDDCTCSSKDDWCDSMVYCENEWDCDHVGGCGSFWQYTCDGLCTTFD